MTTLPAAIPSPGQGVWYLGPVPLRAYALFILLGVFVAVWIGGRRFVARGGARGQVADVAMWAVPFGIVGARLYHVITDWTTYFGPGGSGFVAALKIWQGGLGIWGAVAGGALGAWIACRRAGLLLPPLADAVAPAVAIAQAIGRWGNYFNQELFGRPTDVPWGLQIDVAHRPLEYLGVETFHPTFLYESLWCLAVAAVVWWLDDRLNLGHGRAFAAYVALYCLGRLGVEMMRVDDATHILGLRINIWTSILVGGAAVAYFFVVGAKRPGRETSVYRDGPRLEAVADDAPEAVADAAESAAGNSSPDTGRLSK